MKWKNDLVPIPTNDEKQKDLKVIHKCMHYALPMVNFILFIST